MTIQELPDIITATHIARYLAISRGKVYELLKQIPSAGGIPNFAVGTSRRVTKTDFIDWIESKKKDRVV